MLTSTLSKTTRMAGRQLLAKRAFSAAAEPKAHKASAHWKDLAAKRPIDKDYEHVRTVMFCWKRKEWKNELLKGIVGLACLTESDLIPSDLI